MKNYLFSIAIAFSFGICLTNAQDTTAWKKHLDYDVSQDYRKIRMNFLSPFIDSLNNVKQDQNLPRFLFNENFDTQNAGYWKSFHDPISLRRIIIINVYNLDVLERILKSNYEELNKIADEYKGEFILSVCDIPFYFYSNNDLIRMRIEEIKQTEGEN